MTKCRARTACRERASARSQSPKRLNEPACEAIFGRPRAAHSGGPHGGDAGVWRRKSACFPSESLAPDVATRRALGECPGPCRKWDPASQCPVTQMEPPPGSRIGCSGFERAHQVPPERSTRRAPPSATLMFRSSCEVVELGARKARRRTNPGGSEGPALPSHSLPDPAPRSSSTKRLGPGEWRHSSAPWRVPDQRHALRWGTARLVEAFGRQQAPPSSRGAVEADPAA